MSETTAFQWAITLLIVQGMMGGFDTLYHHELTVDLPNRPSARRELSIHAVRSVLYGVLFAGIAHFAFHGAWVWAVAALVCVEVGLTLWDFVVEDRSRKLPASERVLHTLLAINGGALFGLYAMQLAQWHAAPTALAAIHLGWQGWLLTLFALGVTVSGMRDGWAALRMRHVPTPTNPFAGLEHQRILVTGGTGFIGEALVAQLLDAGHNVTVLTRDPLRAAYLFDGRARCIRHLHTLSSAETFDAIINLAGAPVVGPRWTAQRQRQLLASRVGTTEALLDWLRQAQHPPTVWIQASAIGYYGVRDPSETLTESSATGAGFMAELCSRWEASAEPVTALGVRQVTLRLGLVLGPGGALKPLLLPHRLGLGGRLGDGRQMFSWIHRDDVLALVAHALRNTDMQGIYNTVAPDTVSQAEFAQTAATVLHRPLWLHIPATPVRWVAGEMAQLFVDGQRVVPQRLLDAHYPFKYPTLKSALHDLA